MTKEFLQSLSGLIFLFMFFMHILEDFHLQGILAKMKEKMWWEQNYSDVKYCDDFIIALIMHGYEWAFMIMLPIIIYMIAVGNIHWHFILYGIVINGAIHCYIDHLKCNKYQINLEQDQFFHLIQIFLTWTIWILIYVAKL